MSMQVDFEYPRQVEDMNILKSAIGGFEKNMNRMMLLMKEVGTALEKVSHSYQQLTSLSFSKNAQVRNRVNHFLEEVTAMQEGAPFKEYNTKVHDEVLAPVQGLKTALKEAQKQQQLREKRYKEYQKAKDKVDKTEKTHAKKSKPLETSAKYPLQKKDREQRLENFRAQDVNFQTAFNEMVERMEGVSQETMTCYLHLNANYFASIIDCLTKTDPTVVEVVEQYRLTMKRERQRSIQEEIGRLRAEEHASQTASPHKESELLQNSGHLSGSYSSVRRLPYDTVSPAAGPPMAALEEPVPPSLNHSVEIPNNKSVESDLKDPATERLSHEGEPQLAPSVSESPEQSALDCSPDSKLPPPQYGGVFQ